MDSLLLSRLEIDNLLIRTNPRWTFIMERVELSPLELIVREEEIRFVWFLAMKICTWIVQEATARVGLLALRLGQSVLAVWRGYVAFAKVLRGVLMLRRDNILMWVLVSLDRRCLKHDIPLIAFYSRLKLLFHKQSILCLTWTQYIFTIGLSSLFRIHVICIRRESTCWRAFNIITGVVWWEDLFLLLGSFD